MTTIQPKIKPYYNPVKVFFGDGSFNELPRIAKEYAINSKVLIVSDENLLSILRIEDKLRSMLKEADFKVSFFEKPGKFSSISIIDRGADFVRNEQFGLIIGIGGGSAMDTAKCMAILGKPNTNAGSINLYLKEKYQIEDFGIPLIEIPTTSGTGSEVTRWATVWDLGKKLKKYSLSDEKIFAKAAILDPNLLVSLPPSMTAMTGLDALSQAIEAYWSRNHNPISDVYALQAIKTIINNLELAFQNPSDLTSRKATLYGSLLSGLAFSNTKTTAVHSVSYPMTLHYNVPHGLACALTLGEFLKFNSIPSSNENKMENRIENLPEAPKRIQIIAQTMGCSNVEEAYEKLHTMMTNMDLPTTLHEVGIDEKGIDVILNEGFTPDRVKHNPRIVTRETLKRILQNIL